MLLQGIKGLPTAIGSDYDLWQDWFVLSLVFCFLTRYTKWQLSKIASFPIHLWQHLVYPHFESQKLILLIQYLSLFSIFLPKWLQQIQTWTLDHLAVDQLQIEVSIRYSNPDKYQDSPLYPKPSSRQASIIFTSFQTRPGYLQIMRRLALCISVTRVQDSTSMLLVHCQYYEGTVIPTGNWKRNKKYKRDESQPALWLPFEWSDI